MNDELCREDYLAIGKLTAAVQAFLQTGAAPALLPVFMLVARYRDRTSAELARLEKASLATMGRHLLTLGHVNLGLVQTRPDAGDSRQIKHSLTAKGVALARRLAGAAASVREAA